MKLNQETKDKIYSEYNSFKESMYANKTLEQRQALDQFFTPPELTIPMIEKFDCDSLEDKTILDPCCGSGNLLAACLIAGADPKNLFGNDFDADMVKICKKRLNKICKELNKEPIPTYNIHEGDALRTDSLTEFNKKYEDKYAQDKLMKLENDSLKEEDLWNDLKDLSDELNDAYDEREENVKTAKDIERLCNSF